MSTSANPSSAASPRSRTVQPPTFNLLAFLAVRAAVVALLLAAALPGRAWAQRWPLLCVTEGNIGESSAYLSVVAPNVRAVAPQSDGKMVEMVFTYRGPSAQARPLASGELRQQVGLKLVAGDGCNLLYVMWRVGGSDQIVVSTKTNPGDNQSDDCGNGGYTNVVPDYAAKVVSPRKNANHALRAVLDDNGQLRVTIDRTLVWRGKVAWKKLRLDGPAGLRSDNVDIRVSSMVVRNISSAEQTRRPLPRCPRLVGPG